MTTPELITDKIVEKALEHVNVACVYKEQAMSQMRAALLAVQDDMTQPVYNLLRGWNGIL